MKKFIIPSIIIFGILALAAHVSGGEKQLKDYYNQYIIQKIDDYKRTANIFDDECSNSCMKKLMEMKASQAEFYTEYKTELVNMMLSREVEKRPYKMDYFLITQFKERER